MAIARLGPGLLLTEELRRAHPDRRDEPGDGGGSRINLVGAPKRLISNTIPEGIRFLTITLKPILTYLFLVAQPHW